MKTEIQTIGSLSAELQLEAEMSMKEKITLKKNTRVNWVLLALLLITFILGIFFYSHLSTFVNTIITVTFLGLSIILLLFTPLKIFKPSRIKDTPELKKMIATEYATIISEKIKKIPAEIAEKEENILNIQEDLAAYEKERAGDIFEEQREMEILGKNLVILKEIIQSL